MVNDFDVLEATWPPAATLRIGPWKLRRGDGGGKRVSAATLEGTLADPALAEDGMREWDQALIFQVRDGESDLDAVLNSRGYRPVDATLILSAPVSAIPAMAPSGNAIFCAAPLSCMREIWDAGGIGPGRMATMDRAATPRTWILGRLNDNPTGCAFVSIHEDVAMLHALETAVTARRNGLGRAMTQAAAHWARDHGAIRLTLAVTEANNAARSLYTELGFEQTSRYHYRVAP